MGRYKKIITNISENKIDIVDIILMILLIVSLVALLVLRVDNQKLLEQVDEAMGDYNEISYQYDLLNNSYEEFKKEYQRVIDLMNGTDRYQEAKKLKEE